MKGALRRRVALSIIPGGSSFLIWKEQLPWRPAPPGHKHKRNENKTRKTIPEQLVVGGMGQHYEDVLELATYPAADFKRINCHMSTMEQNETSPRDHRKNKTIAIPALPHKWIPSRTMGPQEIKTNNKFNGEPGVGDDSG